MSILTDIENSILNYVYLNNLFTYFSYTTRYIDVGYSYVANPLYDHRTLLLYFVVPPNALIGRYNISSGKTETVEYGKSCTIIPNYKYKDVFIVTNGLYIDRFLWPLDGSGASFGGNYNEVSACSSKRGNYEKNVLGVFA